MTNSIHGLGTLSAVATSKSAAPAVRSAGGSASTPAVPAADSVSLSAGALGLVEPQPGAGGAADIDHARVGALRAALRDGSYRVDPQAIAARLAALERELLR